MAEWLGAAEFRVRHNGQPAHAWAVRAGHETWVYLDGAVHVLADHDDGTAALPRAPDGLSAPMPARVTLIHVATGDAVEAGAILVTLEAMKMEWQIRAPLAGTVGRIGCRVGELVQPGLPLVELT